MQKVSVFGTKRPRFLLDLAEELYFNKGSRLLSCPLRHHESGGDANGVLTSTLWPTTTHAPRITPSNTEHRKLKSEIRNPKSEHRTSNIEHRTSNIEHRMKARMATTGITHHASRITHHASRITHHASRITHHASRIRSHASGSPSSAKPHGAPPVQAWCARRACS